MTPSALLLIASVIPGFQYHVAIFSERGHSTSIPTEETGTGDDEVLDGVID